MAREATHRVCEEHRRLDVGALNRGGLLNGSGILSWRDGTRITINGSGDSVKLSYVIKGKETQERISISKTAVHLGGHRSWFLCPVCDRRIVALYLAKRFQCRHCLDLRYASQRENKNFRAISRIQKVRRKLGGSGNLTRPLPERPRYMHHRTYQRLIQEEADAWQGYISTL